MGLKAGINGAVSWFRLHGTEGMRIKLARQTSNTKTLLTLAEDCSPSVKYHVATNPTTLASDTVLAKLERLPFVKVSNIHRIWELCDNARNTDSLEELATLIKNPLYCVRKEGFYNQNILELARTTVSSETLIALYKEAEGPFRNELGNTIARRHDLPEQVFKFLGKSSIFDTGKILMANSYAPPRIVAELFVKTFQEKPSQDGTWTDDIAWVDDSCKDTVVGQTFYPASYAYDHADIETMKKILNAHSKGRDPILAVLKEIKPRLHAVLINQ